MNHAAMYEIAIEDTFDAAHCLRDYEGACSRLHGHTYKVRAAFRFDSLEPSGLAFDFRKAKQALRAVIDYLDHQYINELPEFSIRNPTAEAIAKLVFDRLRESIPPVYSVSVWETPTSCATYFEL
jgi:6-pyruvoyltetrahydropterin/6-carboxytetrahydropterin synthase